ncbi:MAG: chemotaxis protein CheB [Burkholderiaceae bacterium]|nr:chemotaxis protein CheB [Burkholderiaceae bacterium]
MTAAAPTTASLLARRDPPVQAICIGASAGGVEALLTVLPGLRAGYRLPIVVVLHLPDDRDSVLAEVFQHHMALDVREARDKEPVGCGTVYFAPPGYHLLVEQDHSFSLSCDPAVNHSRPSIDLLFTSAADAWGPGLAALLLTGANEDGAEGLRAAARAGALTAVQAPAEARVSTMPEAALRLHPSHGQLTLAEIHQLLQDLERRHA